MKSNWQNGFGSTFHRCSIEFEIHRWLIFASGRSRVVAKKNFNPVIVAFGGLHHVVPDEVVHGRLFSSAEVLDSGINIDTIYR